MPSCNILYSQGTNLINIGPSGVITKAIFARWLLQPYRGNTMKKIREYNFRDLYAESINQRTIANDTAPSMCANPSTVLNIKENVLRESVDNDIELQQRLLKDWRSEKLPPTGFYLFDNVNMFVVDKSVRYKLVKIYYEYRQSHEYSTPTPDSLERALNLLQWGRCEPDNEGDISVLEGMALRALDKLDYYQNLQQESMNEYLLARVRDETLLDCVATKKSIFLDMCLRCPEKLLAIKNFGKLRNKTRKRLGLGPTDWVGF